MSGRAMQVAMIAAFTPAPRNRNGLLSRVKSAGKSHM